MRVAIGTIVVSLAGLALAQSVPVPFNSVTSGTTTTQNLDAGTAAVQGVLTVGNDAGVGNNLYVAGAVDVTGNVTGSALFNSNNDALSGGALNFSGNTQLHRIGSTQVGTPTGVAFSIGSGSGISNTCVNVCSLSSQTCNVTCAGATGKSICQAFLLGPNASVLTCDATADAGSATINCAATAAGDAGVLCFD